MPEQNRLYSITFKKKIFKENHNITLNKFSTCVLHKLSYWSHSHFERKMVLSDVILKWEYPRTTPSKFWFRFDQWIQRRIF